MYKFAFWRILQYFQILNKEVERNEYVPNKLSTTATMLYFFKASRVKLGYVSVRQVSQGSPQPHILTEHMADTAIIYSWGILFQKSLFRCIQIVNRKAPPPDKEPQAILCVEPGTFNVERVGIGIVGFAAGLRLVAATSHDPRMEMTRTSHWSRQIMRLPCSVIWDTFALQPEEDNDNGNNESLLLQLT